MAEIPALRGKIARRVPFVVVEVLLAVARPLGRPVLHESWQELVVVLLVDNEIPVSAQFPALNLSIVFRDHQVVLRCDNFPVLHPLVRVDQHLINLRGLVGTRAWDHGPEGALHHCRLLVGLHAIRIAHPDTGETSRDLESQDFARLAADN